MQTQYQIGDCLMADTVKGQPAFPVFEVVAIKEFNMRWCYICFVRQCFNGVLQRDMQLVPLAVAQQGLALYSTEGEYTSTINEDHN